MARSIALYPAYRALRGLLFWMPVFFLFFQRELTMAQALWLEAIYYTAFVLLEVPSGYLSDAVGRRPTLLLGAALSGAGALLFALGSGSVAWAAGQVLFAAGFSFDSGTDQSLLYDALASEGREAEFRAIEARAAAWNLGAVAVASLLGGVLGTVDLRLPYLATALAALAALAVAWQFEEPSRARASSPRAQLAEVLTTLRDPLLRWTTTAAVAGTVLNHVPYEFLQPWLAALTGSEQAAAIWSGGLSVLIVLLAAWASERSDSWAERIAPTALLVGMLALQVVVIACMGLAVTPWLLPLLLLRGVPGAVNRPLMGDLQHPRMASSVRATVLSVQSLAGRLAFGFTLLAAGAGASGGMGLPLLAYAGAGAMLVAGLALARPTETLVH